MISTNLTFFGNERHHKHIFERITPNTLTKLHSPSISLSNFMFMESTKAMNKRALI